MRLMPFPMMADCGTTEQFNEGFRARTLYVYAAPFCGKTALVGKAMFGITISPQIPELGGVPPLCIRLRTTPAPPSSV